MNVRQIAPHPRFSRQSLLINTFHLARAAPDSLDDTVMELNQAQKIAIMASVAAMPSALAAILKWEDCDGRY
jgi:hypothetical protein